MEYAESVDCVVLDSSNLPGDRSFGADRTVDGNLDSCWCASTTIPNSPDASGSGIVCTLEGPVKIIGFSMVNGNLYLPEEELYLRNGQVKMFTVTLGGEAYSFEADFNYGDQTMVQYYRLPEPVLADSFEFRVDAVYPGEKYATNVCVTEFTAYQGK